MANGGCVRIVTCRWHTGVGAVQSSNLMRARFFEICAHAASWAACRASGDVSVTAPKTVLPSDAFSPFGCSDVASSCRRRMVCAVVRSRQQLGQCVNDWNGRKTRSLPAAPSPFAPVSPASGNERITESSRGRSGLAPGDRCQEADRGEPFAPGLRPAALCARRAVGTDPVPAGCIPGRRAR